MAVFAAFFGVFLVVRIGQPQVFAASRTQLEVPLGLVDTIVLLTSSLLVALAVRRVRAGRRAFAGRLLVAAAAGGVVFLALKVTEYSIVIGEGHAPSSNDFFLYYFVLTGIHLTHVLIGLGGLAIARSAVRRPVPSPDLGRTVENAASFWHMVDLLWIVLFALFYLVA
ncbi:cytochrome c oxidase subunit 3 family protein [Actinomycetospora sp. TBRC 11914]|nr:cytochrome c oxidase subunit 3 family protein [Actinomycetospora sp. TBRC 11914]